MERVTVDQLANSLNEYNIFEVVNYYRFLAGLGAQMFGPGIGLEVTYENEVVSFRDKDSCPVGIETLTDEKPEAKE